VSIQLPEDGRHYSGECDWGPLGLAKDSRVLLLTVFTGQRHDYIRSLFCQRYYTAIRRPGPMTLDRPRPLRRRSASPASKQTWGASARLVVVIASAAALLLLLLLLPLRTGRRAYPPFT